MTLMLRPVSVANCSRICLVGLGVAANAAFKVSSCFALIVVRGPLRLVPPGWFSSFAMLPAEPDAWVGEEGSPIPKLAEPLVQPMPESLIELLADIGELLLERWWEEPWLRLFNEAIGSRPNNDSSSLSESSSSLAPRSPSPGLIKLSSRSGSSVSWDTSLIRPERA